MFWGKMHFSNFQLQLKMQFSNFLKKTMQTTFSVSAGAIQPSPFGGIIVGEAKPALSLSLMPRSVLNLQIWDC